MFTKHLQTTFLTQNTKISNHFFNNQTNKNIQQTKQNIAKKYCKNTIKPLFFQTKNKKNEKTIIAKNHQTAAIQQLFDKCIPNLYLFHF